MKLLRALLYIYMAGVWTAGALAFRFSDGANMICPYASPARGTSDATAKSELATPATAGDSTFVGRFFCEESKIAMQLNLLEENLTAPGYDFLGPLHGYMHGGCYGVWLLLDFEPVKSGRGVLLRFTNDIGSDTQTIRFTPQPDGTFLYETVGGNKVQRVGTGRNLVKMSSKMTFRKQ